jgi:diacylglycerol kinase family enzyme
MDSREGVAAGRPRAAGSCSVRSVEVLINPLAGHVDPDAAAQAGQILAQAGVAAHVRTPEPATLRRELRAATDSGPDLLVTLAGDGTAQAAASLCGPAGPLLAPLAGGTMNVLSHALYGPRDWRSVLAEILVGGAPTPVSGGEIDGRRFYVAAILGAPTLWAEAREAARMGKLALAARKARNAWRRAFSRRLRYRLDGGAPQISLALTLICPLVSRALADDERALEAAALDPRGIADALRLGARAALGRVVGDWRTDPAVEVARCHAGEAWTSGAPLHAMLDGEPARLHKRVRICFVPQAFRALTLADSSATIPGPPA